MKEKRNAIIAAVILVVIIVVAVAAYNALVVSGGSKSSEQTTQSSSAQSGATLSGSSQGTSSAQSGSSSSSSSSSSTSSSKTSAIADFTVVDENGAEVKLSSMQGKPTVLGFWASWCPSCTKEAPDVQTLYEKYGDRVNFMMIDSVDGSRETINSGKAFKSDHGYTYPIYFDTTMEASRAGRAYYLPTMYILNADGSVAEAFSSVITVQSGSSVLDGLLG